MSDIWGTLDVIIEGIDSREIAEDIKNILIRRMDPFDNTIRIDGSPGKYSVWGYAIGHCSNPPNTCMESLIQTILEKYHQHININTSKLYFYYMEEPDEEESFAVWYDLGKKEGVF